MREISREKVRVYKTCKQKSERGKQTYIQTDIHTYIQTDGRTDIKLNVIFLGVGLNGSGSENASAMFLLFFEWMLLLLKMRLRLPGIKLTMFLF